MAFSNDRPIVEEIEFDVSGSRLAIPHGLTIDVNQQSAYPFVGFFSNSLGYQSRLVRTDIAGTLLVTGSVDVTKAVSVVQDDASLLQASIQGLSPSGSIWVGNPLLIAGADNAGRVRVPLIDANGSTFVRQDEEATFFFAAAPVVVTTNKSMMSILNAGSRVVKIRSIRLANVQTTSLTGVVGVFELRRMTNHSVGTLVVGEAADLLDVAALTGVTVRTGATVSGESSTLIRRVLWSTDEWGPGAADAETYEHAVAQSFPLYVRDDNNQKPLILRANQGLTVKQTTGNAGAFDVYLVITVM